MSKNIDPFADDAQEATSAYTPLDDDADYEDVRSFEQFDAPGREVSGVYLGYTTVMIADRAKRGELKPLNQHTIATASGPVRFNESAGLRDLAQFPAGVRVKVRYIGSLDTPQGEMKDFAIRVHKDDRASIGAAAMAALAPISAAAIK